MNDLRVLGEFGGPRELVHAVRCMRALGWEHLETYTPIPVAEVDQALGRERSRLPMVSLTFALLGAGGAYYLQWLINSVLYPLDAGGRPAHFPLAFVPITFEMGVLLAALLTVVAVFAGARLVRLWHPVFEADGFASATSTGYWLEVRVGRLERDRAAADLRGCGSLRVSLAEGDR